MGNSRAASSGCGDDDGERKDRSDVRGSGGGAVGRGRGRGSGDNSGSKGSAGG